MLKSKKRWHWIGLGFFLVTLLVWCEKKPANTVETADPFEQVKEAR